MWKFQYKLRGTGVQEYTAKEVHADLTAMMLLFLSDIQQEIERKEVPQEVTAEKSLLAKLGFKKAKNTEFATQITNVVAEHNKACDEKKAALEFMHKAWATFGKDIMVVRYEQFLSLLEKYNLVCGSFDRYTGTIPAKNLADIERVMSVLENGGMDMTVPFRYITEVDTDSNNLKWLQYFNIYPMQLALKVQLFNLMGLTLSAGDEKPKANSSRVSPLGDFLSIQPVIDPQLRFMCYNLMAGKDSAGSKPERYCNLTDESCHIFIAAPAQEMDNFEIKTYSSKAILERAEQEHGLEEEARRRQVRTADPFICSLTPYGVMIYTKWGDEAQDSIIKRYEQLRDAVIGEGGNQ